MKRLPLTRVSGEICCRANFALYKCKSDILRLKCQWPSCQFLSSLAVESFENEKPLRGSPALPPTSGKKAKSRIAAPDIWRADVGEVPRTRPREISNGVSLTDKIRRERLAFVSEQAAFDATLTVFPMAGVSPNENSGPGVVAQDDVRARPDKLPLRARRSLPAAVVPTIEREAGSVAVSRKPPKGGDALAALLTSCLLGWLLPRFPRLG